MKMVMTADRFSVLWRHSRECLAGTRSVVTCSVRQSWNQHDRHKKGVGGSIDVKRHMHMTWHVPHAMTSTELLVATGQCHDACDVLWTQTCSARVSLAKLAPRHQSRLSLLTPKMCIAMEKPCELEWCNGEVKRSEHAALKHATEGWGLDERQCLPLCQLRAISQTRRCCRAFQPTCINIL